MSMYVTLAGPATISCCFILVFPVSGKSLWLTVANVPSFRSLPQALSHPPARVSQMGSSLSLKLSSEQTWRPRLGQHSQNTASVPKQEVTMSLRGTVSSCFQGWAFPHIWVSQVPGPGRPSSSLPLLVNAQPLPPRSALPSARPQPLGAQYLHTQPLSRLRPVRGSLLR